MFNSAHEKCAFSFLISHRPALTVSSPLRRFDVPAVLSPDLTLNETAWESAAPLLLTPYFALSYAFSFAALTSVITHVALFHGPEIRRALWSRGKGESEEEEDIHNRLMRSYEPVPRSWFVSIIAVNLAASVVLVTFAPLQVPPSPSVLPSAALDLTSTSPDANLGPFPLPPPRRHLPRPDRHRLGYQRHNNRIERRVRVPHWRAPSWRAGWQHLLQMFGLHDDVSRAGRGALSEVEKADSVAEWRRSQALDLTSDLKCAVQPASHLLYFHAESSVPPCVRLALYLKIPCVRFAPLRLLTRQPEPPPRRSSAATRR